MFSCQIYRDWKIKK